MAESIGYTAPDGSTFNFSTNNVAGGLINHGIDGRTMPPSSILSDTVPLADGAIYRGQIFNPRPISIAITFVGTTRSSVRALMRDLASSVNPRQATSATQATGILTVTTEDSVTRQLYCNYVGGLESTDVDQRPSMQRVVLNFLALDPFWYNLSATGLTVHNNTVSGLFFPVSINPFRLYSSTVFYSSTYNNPGDVATDLHWLVNGPGADLVLRNDTTGEVLGLLGYTLSAGQQILINSKDATITREDGTDLYGSLTSRDFWQLQPGDNNISIQFAGTDSGSSVTLAYNEKYLGI